MKEEERPIYGVIHSWSVHGQMAEIAIRTHRKDGALPDERYQDTRTVEDVYLSLDNVTRIEFVDPKRTVGETA